MRGYLESSFGHVKLEMSLRHPSGDGESACIRHLVRGVVRQMY